MKPIIDVYHWLDIGSCHMDVVAMFVGVELRKHELSIDQFLSFQQAMQSSTKPHMIPWIEDNGVKIVSTPDDLNVIYAYLVDRYMPKNQRFYPRDPLYRAYVNKFLEMDVYICQLLNIAYNRLMPSKHTPEEGLDLLRFNLALFDGILQKLDRKYTICDELTLADVSISVCLCFIEAFGFDTSNLKTLTRYHKDLKKAIPNYDSIKNRVDKYLKSCEEMEEMGLTVLTRMFGASRT